MMLETVKRPDGSQTSTLLAPERVTRTDYEAELAYMLSCSDFGEDWYRVHAYRQGFRGSLGVIDCLPNEA